MDKEHKITMNKPLLDIQNLSVCFEDYAIVDNLSFSLHKKEPLCIVGESGCGKSMTSLALMQLLPQEARLRADKIEFNNKDLLNLSKKEMTNIRGNELAMIFQDPMSALNPVLKLGDQIAEPLIRHKKMSKKEALEEAIQLLEKVGIEDAHKRIKEYAHQFSGGMLQRVMIAMMLACKPALLIADEPTTALDVDTQAQILDLLNNLIDNNDLGLIFITHDMSVAKKIAHNIAVMYAGKIVEFAKAQDFFAKPMHPYSKALFDSIPSEKNRYLDRLPTIKGSVPPPNEIILGCRFKNRCPNADQECDNPPPLQNINNRQILCKLNFSN